MYRKKKRSNKYFIHKEPLESGSQLVEKLYFRQAGKALEKGQADEEQVLVAVCRYSRAPVLK
ncbi:MAG: hypothetical protein Q8865_03855 [Bacillota bacterium]|nr:hypothetical protein [Bacillota bacterium]